METLLIRQSEVRELLAMGEAIAAVEGAFAAHGRGEARMPEKVYLELPEHGGDFRAMPAALPGAAGVKWVNAHPRNPERYGLPSVRGTYVLSDPATAEPLAVMDATRLTAVRTGAAAAIASQHLARRPVRSLGMVGCGVQARTLFAAHRELFGELETIAADRSAEAAEAFAAEVGGRAGSVEEACGADVVCTATPSRRPVVRERWIAAGTHVNAMGADGPGKQELAPAILRRALVVVDDLGQACGSGEVNVPLAGGELSREAIHATLGEVVGGLRPGRTADDQVTLFDSTGLAIQDLVLARLVERRARARGVGTAIDLFA